VTQLTAAERPGDAYLLTSQELHCVPVLLRTHNPGELPLHGLNLHFNPTRALFLERIRFFDQNSQLLVKVSEMQVRGAFRENLCGYIL
jgi:hypothetical protein